MALILGIEWMEEIEALESMGEGHDSIICHALKMSERDAQRMVTPRASMLR